MVYRKQMEKRNVRLSREGAGTTKMFLDAKGNVIPGSTKSLAIGVPGTIAGVLQSMQN
jgi:gamma-glutamyltranspeptidase